ncbi:hypothetical protein [Rubrivirga sp.]|uniref:hypothetical protein n=1 Tax=Rubrivirga sp. TaxID=1885344 RepID=UPI003C73A16F
MADSLQTLVSSTSSLLSLACEVDARGGVVEAAIVVTTADSARVESGEPSVVVRAWRGGDLVWPEVREGEAVAVPTTGVEVVTNVGPGGRLPVYPTLGPRDTVGVGVPLREGDLVLCETTASVGPTALPGEVAATGDLVTVYDLVRVE